MPRARIMLVEDEAITALDIRTSLEGYGYEVPAVVATGADAVRVAAEIRPDLILMDITLDGSMTGIQAAEKVHRQQPIPIIFLTAHQDNETLASAIWAEPFAYLTKPCDQKSLQNAIEVALYKGRADARIRESEERYRSLVEMAPVAIAVHSGGNFCYCNAATIRLFGAVSEAELLNRTILEVVHPDSRIRVWERIAKTLATGQSTTVAAEHYRRLDGGDLIVEVFAIPTTFKGKPALQEIYHDITAQKQAEEVLKQAREDLELRVAERTVALEQANNQMKKVSFELVWAEEKERERIAAELHDRVGQSLLLAKMKLDALESSLVDDLFTTAREAAALVETSIRDIRSLTFRMRPPILDTSGIETTLEWLCSSIKNDYGMHIDFVQDDQLKPLSVEVRYSLYQAVRELLLNVVKHARTEKAHLQLTTDNRTLIVRVIDEGIGFPQPDAHLKQIEGGGYGLYNVQQRIEQMGGRFTIDSEPGKGTAVTMQVPLSHSAP